MIRFQPFIWGLLKIVKDWMNSLTHSFIQPTNRWSLSTLSVLMLVTGDSWLSLHLRCLGSRESSTQQRALHSCTVDNDRAKRSMQIISVKRYSLSHLPDDCFPSSSSLSSFGKESTCNAGDTGSIPGSGWSPGEGKGYLLQYSGLENSMDCIVHGVTKSQTRLSDFHFHFPGRCALMMWERERVYFSLPPWGGGVELGKSTGLAPRQSWVSISVLPFLSCQTLVTSPLGVSIS